MLISTKRRIERVFLVGVHIKGRPELWEPEDSLEELGELARSAGGQVVGSMVQELDKPTQTYIGKGKLEALKLLVSQHRINTVICDDELAPRQQLNIEKSLQGTKVIDRTALILDVFASRAQTKEGRLQVELAQHEYLLPRLAGQWSHLERLGGGIGTRGPGETQLETDRRLVNNRIRRLKKSLKDVHRHRELYRARRKDQKIPVVSIVGYTNAGKSTLLNKLTGAAAKTENRLFSTLDPLTRRIILPSGRELLLTDTVGFIQKLPPAVVAAFSATLEEIHEASIIMHVIDITHPNAAEQAHVVDQILTRLELANKPRLLVLNKMDLLEPLERNSTYVDPQEAISPGNKAILISALNGNGLKHLLKDIDNALEQTSLPIIKSIAEHSQLVTH